MKRYAIVGFGCAGFNAAKAIRTLDRQCVIDVYDASDGMPANPALTSLHITGEVEKSDLFRFGDAASLCRELNLNMIIGKTVVRVGADRTVETAGGGKKDYDRLLISTGAHAYVPSSIRRSGDKHFLTHTAGDADSLREFIRRNPIKKAVVAGASTAGIKAAAVFYDIGAKVVVVDAASYAFPLIACRETAGRIQCALEKKGVTMLFDAEIAGIEEGNILYAGGGVTKADVAVICLGARPNTEVVKGQGIRTGYGVIVNEKMMTNIEGIYAAGDCCEIDGQETGSRMSGMWETTALQGKYAGMNMAGGECSYCGVLSDCVHFFGMDFIWMGDPSAAGEVCEFENAHGYIRVVINNNKIRCVNMLGHYSISGIIRSCMLKRLRGAQEILSDTQKGLLISSGLPPFFVNTIGGEKYE